MNAVEIEEAVSNLVEHPFDEVEFPFLFLDAFGNKDTTLKRLRSGSSNASDVPGGVLQRNNIHIAVASPGAVDTTLAALRKSPKTGSAKAKFLLATDGVTVEAEDLLSGETVTCDYRDLAQHFGFFLPLAGISTVKEIKNNPIDVKATGRLNKLYIELLKENPDWATAARRHALNQFMARLIFCFFAEDTGIFVPQQFTDTIRQMSDSQADNTHEVLTELFRAMDMQKEERAAQEIRSWADKFPYVNGGLFTGVADCPRFSRIARSYLLRVGELNWKEINPDIFGSMIQAVADDSERGELGLHYTSVPNILKVLNPLFLDNLREQLEAAGDNSRKLKNLRKRLSMIRVFDPACGSGNFLVIAYKAMRAIEAEIVRRLGDEERRSVIPLSNFYGIEIKGFAAEIARLALLIAEFQADCLHLSQHEARAMVLPLHRTGQIHVGNALRLDWQEVCRPPTKTDLTESPFDAAPVPKIYICGNPPYKGSKRQSGDEKEDLEQSFLGTSIDWKPLDYVAGWYAKAAVYASETPASFAFVSTKSICQGQQVSILWPFIFNLRLAIAFAHTSFRWTNLASHNAGVTVVIIGISAESTDNRTLFSEDEHGKTVARSVANINAYLVPGDAVIVSPRSHRSDGLPEMERGNSPTDGGQLLLEPDEVNELELTREQRSRFIKPFVGSSELINGSRRYCIWISDDAVEEAQAIPGIDRRVQRVREFRLSSTKKSTVAAAAWPHRFDERKPLPVKPLICVPITSSENREYLPVGVLERGTVISNLSFGMVGESLWALSLIASRLNRVWVATVCARMRTDYRYTNTLAWNTFPVPKLTEQDKTELTRCAENILLAREAHFPATIAELYDPNRMPENLRRAHEMNDEVLERVYIGRRFRNDTERLEKLFELYTRTNSPRVDNEKERKKNRKGKVRTA